MTGQIKIAASEFKAQCLGLLDHVQENREELVITKRGKPVAKLVPLAEEKPWLRLRGRGKLLGDPFAPVIEESEIEALK